MTNLYPLDNPLPIWQHECHDDGAALWVDDPVTMFSGVEATKGANDERDIT